MPTKDNPSDDSIDIFADAKSKKTIASKRRSAPLVAVDQSADDAPAEPVLKPVHKVVIEPIHPDAAVENEDDAKNTTEQQIDPVKPDDDLKEKKPATDVSVDEAVATETARAERAKKIDELIDSEKYFVPINAARAKRNRRRAVLGLLLIIVLAVAWYNVSLDAHILPNTFNLPHTQLFGS